MKFEDLTQFMQDRYVVLTKHASQTMVAEIEDALDKADDQDEFVAAIELNLDTIRKEATSLIDEFWLSHDRGRCRVRKDLADQGLHPSVMNARFEEMFLPDKYLNCEFSIIRDCPEEEHGVKVVTSDAIVFYFNSIDIERLS